MVSVFRICIWHTLQTLHMHGTVYNLIFLEIFREIIIRLLTGLIFKTNEWNQKQMFKLFLYIPLEREPSFPQGLGLWDLLRKNKNKQRLRTSMSIYIYVLSSWHTCRNSGGKPSKLCGGNARGQLGYLVQMREWHVCWYTDLSARDCVSSKERLAIQTHLNCDYTLGFIWIIRINIHCIHNKSIHFIIPYLN